MGWALWLLVPSLGDAGAAADDEDKAAELVLDADTEDDVVLADEVEDDAEVDVEVIELKLDVTVSSSPATYSAKDG